MPKMKMPKMPHSKGRRHIHRPWIPDHPHPHHTEYRVLEMPNEMRHTTSLSLGLLVVLWKDSAVNMPRVHAAQARDIIYH